MEELRMVKIDVYEIPPANQPGITPKNGLPPFDSDLMNLMDAPPGFINLFSTSAHGYRMVNINHLVKMPLGTLVYDLVYKLMETSYIPSADKRGLHNSIYSTYTIYRQGPHGYVVCSMDEPLFLNDNPNQITSVLAVSKYKKCDDSLCLPWARYHESASRGPIKNILKPGSIETILGPRPATRSAPRPSPSRRAASLSRPSTRPEPSRPSPHPSIRPAPKPRSGGTKKYHRKI